MPTREEWTKVYTELATKLNLPCKLVFSTEVKVGSHGWEDEGDCHITINPEADFRVPEHLILHENEHHRADIKTYLDIGFWGHSEHWAKILCDMYAETGIALPQTTSFIEFAKAAGIERKNFAREDDVR